MLIVIPVERSTKYAREKRIVYLNIKKKPTEIHRQMLFRNVNAHIYEKNKFIIIIILKEKQH